MPKEILFRGVPQAVLSETFGAVYPVDKDRQENGALIVGARVNVPYDPESGVMANATLYNPATLKPEIERTPNIFRTVIANAAGYTTLWTPATGKRFRLMGYSVIVPNTATSAAGSNVNLADGTTDIGTLVSIGATAGAIAYTVNYPGNGYLAPAINTLLRVNLSAAFTAGNVAVTAWGTEE